MNLLSKIIKTIKYSKKFKGELDLDKLYFRLLSSEKYSKNEISKTIKNYELRITNSKINKENTKKINLAKELVKNHLSKFDNILMVGITGSVAAENSRKNEDIDIFIICKNGTMWLTRLLLRIYIKLNKIPHRKFGQKEKPNDFCFNLWMDENNLLVPKLKQNQKNAVDLILVKVIFDKDNVYQEFVLNNKWVKKYVTNGYNQLKITNYKLQIKRDKTGIIVKSLNYSMYLIQIMYIRLKGPIKFISLGQAFFHK